MTSSNPRIRILVTGGTFDKEYDEISGRLFFKQTHLPEMLQLGRCLLSLQIERLLMVDSLEMSDGDRELIVSCCRSSPETALLITHGTDTMTETAAWLGRASLGKTIVLTGAMIPYKFGSSDGLFNLGSALAFVQTLPPDVYIAMNGRCFRWDTVHKNRERGIFESNSHVS
ncbi:MAG: asparaginase domain-containing protein [Bryobacteraceae bacterium]